MSEVGHKRPYEDAARKQPQNPYNPFGILVCYTDRKNAKPLTTMRFEQLIPRQHYQLLYGPMRPCKHCWGSSPSQELSDAKT